MIKVRGKGTITPMEKGKCRKWRLQVCIGKDLATGKYRQLSRVVKDCNKTEANAAMREFIQEIESGQVTPRKSTMLFSEYAAAWLEERKKEKAHGTWRVGCDHIKCANMHIGNARLHEITPQVIEEMYKGLQEGKSPSGRPLSGTYVSDVGSTLHKLFWRAVKDGHVPSNPCDYAKRPAIDTPEKKHLPKTSMIELIGKLDPKQPTQLAILLCVTTGMRRGEAHGLCWADVDFVNMVIHVRHSYDSAGNLNSTKTKSGLRDLPMQEVTANALMVMLERQVKLFARTRRKMGTRWDPVLSSKTPVISNGLGERMLPQATTRWFTRHRSDLGVPGATVHELRHSYLTELAHHTSTKVLQKIAGHAHYSTTEQIYVHVTMDDKREAVSKIDFLSRDSNAEGREFMQEFTQE